jgi:uncharacterized membrane protein (DUF485 family)
MSRDLQDLARARARIATVLTLAMIVLYFGFVTLIAYDKPLMGRLITPGLSLGILLGVLVIVGSWIFTWIYVRWANRHYDAAVGRIER